ncbi:MAG TPA: hypothetical protein VGM80_03700 [Gaiellaceae bacterium]
MRELENILRDVTMTGLAFAIAIGWSLLQVAQGVSTFVEGLATHVSDQGSYAGSFAAGAMTWTVGHHVLTIDGLVTGLVELAVVLATAAYVRSRYGSGGTSRAARRHPS